MTQSLDGTPFEMNPIPDLRPYRDISDLPALQQVLRRGRQAGGPTFYVHPGDLAWWLFYPPLSGSDPCEHLYLWEDAARPGTLLGWVLLSPDGWNTFDVVLQPELQSGPQAEALLLWAEEKLSQIVGSSQPADEKRFVRCMWIAEQDAFHRRWLESRGFHERGADVHFVYDLKQPPAEPLLPPGFTIRPVAALSDPQGLAESIQRAAAQKASFGSTAPWEAYLQRYQNLMRSPVYSQLLDLAVFAPDGRAAAFCLLWLDAESGWGNFEPVGTHPDFHRQGLSKALLHHALRRLHDMGYHSAQVTTNANLAPAIQLYESAGFRLEHQLAIYEKEITPLPAAELAPVEKSHD